MRRIPAGASPASEVLAGEEDLRKLFREMALGGMHASALGSRFAELLSTHSALFGKAVSSMVGAVTRVSGGGQGPLSKEPLLPMPVPTDSA